MDYPSKVTVIICIAVAVGYVFSGSMVLEYYVEKFKSVCRKIFS